MNTILTNVSTFQIFDCSHPAPDRQPRVWYSSSNCRILNSMITRHVLVCNKRKMWGFFFKNFSTRLVGTEKFLLMTPLKPMTAAINRTDQQYLFRHLCTGLCTSPITVLCTCTFSLKKVEVEAHTESLESFLLPQSFASA